MFDTYDYDSESEPEPTKNHQEISLFKLDSEAPYQYLTRCAEIIQNALDPESSGESIERCQNVISILSRSPVIMSNAQSNLFFLETLSKVFFALKSCFFF